MRIVHRRLIALLILMAGAAVPAEAIAGSCVPPAGRYDFVIDVSGVGKVGALTGVVKDVNGKTTVDIETEIVVRLGGIVVHRHVETRHTEWREGRLTLYTADIKSNGKEERVRVTRDGDGLTAMRNGTRSALPGDAVPGFPWARCITDRKHIFGLHSLRLSRVVVVGSLPLALSIGGRDVPAREIRFRTPESWIAWFADDGTLLRHAFDSGGRRVTLTRVLPKR